MTAPTRRRPLALLAASLLTGLLALPLIAAAPAAAQARDISNACQGAPQSNFSDRGNAAQAEAIDCIAGYGITQGQTATSYGTGAPVQRDQMATFLVREMLLVAGNNLPAAPAENQFPCDVRETNANGQPNPHYENIQRLAATRNPRIAQGGAGGSPATCYTPTGAVTRGQMASFIVRHLQFLGVPLPTTAPDAFDDDNGNIHESNINLVAALGIAQGTSTRRFQPNAPTTRGQMAFFLSRDLSVLVEANKLTNKFTGGVTVQPELTSAALADTSGTGTRVRFTFDADVATATVTSSKFFVHQADNTRFTGASGTIEAGGRSVLVNFTGLTTTAAAEQLTLATVDDGAVTYTNGVTNPEGAAAIGSAATTPDAQPGTTTAPDLLRVENPRAGGTPGVTAVNFVFDQNAFRTTGTPGAFHLVLTDGFESECEAPAAGSTTASGGTAAGGEGTNTFTVICDNPPAAPPLPAPSLQPIAIDDIARGTVGQGAVASTAGQVASAAAANQNPLQASNTPHRTGAAPPGPDLVSAAFTAGAAGAADGVVYTFDQSVATATGAANLFRVYLNNGTEVVGTGTPTINPANAAQIRVTFPAGTLANAVGASVRDAAVTGTGSAANAVANKQDEVSASLGGSTTRTPGQTSGPNLTTVVLSRPPDLFGNPGDFVAAYTFDEPVTLQNAAQGGAPTNVAGETLFHLFTSGGGRFTATDCTVGTGANTNRVTCTAYNVAGGSAATSAQIGSAVLGTVDFAAVFGAGGAQTNAQDRNPEGARPTSGGTGTPSR